ncbi:hypothetical protein [Cellulomonas fimi]|uniref:Uncharacterized protein n=1 Tax=Cellulomonas fimi (strain ATCC 484 / DSM 20113 / JCM 1341 / CCUG 24087 / LMG 16345 / NBRC 15513 / NCIMB 8980 / NCTC 7547 / NRS-133) TaxID=590998 RepID=F4H003_CELFA|nr:hypothetical protein [Cellulomonas fimi]AEE44925.1 hypothetical protein Celf_0785 [Cellulomonas fimi ATCC 484]NNH07252.1 hypothetical protein [Cellulomonas fimi]VEH27698.1 Uncharacterised protein [Cellulomonas fimi]
MLTIRTIRLALLASAAALTVWLLTGVLHVLLARLDVPAGLVGFVAPSTPAVGLAHGSVGAALLAAATLVVAVGFLVLPALRAAGTGYAGRVLAVWLAVVVAGAAAALFTGWPATVHALGQGRDGTVPLLMFGWFEPIRRGTGWGATWGWLVGLAVVALARRDEDRPEQPTVARPVATAAAVVAGLVAGAGWTVAAAVHAWVDRTVATHATTGRSTLAITVSTTADWFAPVTTAGEASTGALLACGGLVAAITGGLAYLAARTAAATHGRTVLVLGVWAACVAGALWGALPTALVGDGLDPTGDGRWLRQQDLLQLGPTDGGAAGLLYGWLPALLALLVVQRLRAATPVPREPGGPSPAPAAAVAGG